MILNPKDGAPDTVTGQTKEKIKREANRCGDGCIQIIPEPEDKNYRVFFTKRRRINDNSSVSFGYTKEYSPWVGDHS
jgi:hypothetical protein